MARSDPANVTACHMADVGQCQLHAAVRPASPTWPDIQTCGRGRLLDETFLYTNRAAASWPIHIAEAKTSAPFGQEVLRGFFCNYLVCLGVWQATGAQDIIGKIIGVFFPVLAFVAISEPLPRAHYAVQLCRCSSLSSSAPMPVRDRVLTVWHTHRL